MTPLELLAPARNADIGIAAIRCGADAVYIGGPAFGARVSAGNSVEDIRRLCTYARHYGVRIFVTVNTLFREEEKPEAVAMMLKMKNIGISAFIMQDCTLLPLLREYGPWKEEFHASTQCAIRTVERARQLAALGFTRLVLERQMPIGEVRRIHAAVPGCELEFFVHGALCVCYSGDCYLSEYLTGRSANRGECSQPCRSRYDLVSADGNVLCANRPLLSLKDLKLIDRLGDLADAGVVSFKIEGRLKNASYVKNVVRAYSIALDVLVAGSNGRYDRASRGKCEGGFTPDPDKTFNRGYTPLYLDGKRGEWHSDFAAKGTGEAIGSFDKGGVRLNRGVQLHNGDGLCYIDRNSEVAGLRIDRIDKLHFPMADVRPGSVLWRNLDFAFEKELENNMPRRLVGVRVNLVFREGALDAFCTGGFASVASSICLHTDIADWKEADNQSRMRELLRAQISKRTSVSADGGDYSFSLDGIEDGGKPLPLLSASFINGIRRNLAEALDAQAEALDAQAEVSHPEKEHLPDSFPADDLAHPRREGELMRTRYCLRYRMGQCLKKGGKSCSAVEAGEWYLRNNGRTIRLRFDCANCEMILSV